MRRTVVWGEASVVLRIMLIQFCKSEADLFPVRKIVYDLSFLILMRKKHNRAPTSSDKNPQF